MPEVSLESHLGGLERSRLADHRHRAAGAVVQV